MAPKNRQSAFVLSLFVDTDSEFDKRECCSFKSERLIIDSLLSIYPGVFCIDAQVL